MSRNTLLLLCSFAAVANPLAAQRPWSVTLEVGWLHFSGSSRDTAGAAGAPSGGPGTSTGLGLRLSRDFGRWRLSMGFLYASPGLSIASADLEVVARNTFSLAELTPEVAVQVKRFRTGAVLRLHGGVALDAWSPDGAASRLIVGGLAAASIELPVTTRMAVQLRYEGLVSGSVFTEADLPAGFARRATLRTRLGVGIALGI